MHETLQIIVFLGMFAVVVSVMKIMGFGGE